MMRPMNTISQRMQSVQSPVIPAVAALIRANPGTISLGQGVVHYGPPPEAFAAMDGLRAAPDFNKYQPVHGIPHLIEAIEKKLAAENGIETNDASRVIVTAGGNMAFVNAVLAVADPGDEIILPLPYYFNHEMAVTLASCRPVLVATADDYQLLPEAVERALTPRTRAVVTVSPNNPTGAVYGEEALRAVNALCAKHGIYHISDEAYEYFTFDGAKHFSPGSIPGAGSHTISLYSLSKAYGFAGWRIGYMAVPAQLFPAINKIQDTNLICPPVISQLAAVAILRVGRGYCDDKLAGIAEVRDAVLNELGMLAPRCVVARAAGAFYCFLGVNSDLDPMQLVHRLIREYRVAVIPGSAFGIENSCALRISYGALQKATAIEGLGRLVAGLNHILGA